MRVSDLLTAVASWLEDPNNEIFLLSEYDDDCLSTVAVGLSEAASALRKTAEETDLIEPAEDSKLTQESIDEMATLASEFDKSGDELLKKQASVLDEILLTIAANPEMVSNLKLAQQKKIDVIKKKYHEPKEELDSVNKVADVQKAVDASGMTKQYRVLEAPLNTRYCPDHTGSMLSRKGENIWQCELDGKVYNFESGYTKENGDKVPGGSVDLQTPPEYNTAPSIFDTREGRLTSSKP